MKKFLLSIPCFVFGFFSFAGIASAESDGLANFNFEDAAKRAVTNFTTVFYPADGGIIENKDNADIRLNGASSAGFITGSGGAGTFAPNSNGWNGGMDTKYWQMNFSTVDYKDIKLSSRQYSSGTGPRDFKVQWSIDGLTWTDVSGSSVTLATNWTSGSLNNIVLPVDVENQSIVYLRWIMTSNVNVGGGVVGASGTSRIDDVAIIGTPTDMASWRFEDAVKSAATDFVSVFYTADDGLAQNKDISEIKLNGSLFTTFVQGSGGAGTFAPSSNNWDGGMDTKYWSVNFSTTGYKDLKFSSKQYGSATGPRDFKVQWSLDGTTWTDVAGGSVAITTAESWVPGVLNNIPLPNEVENQSIVYLRWIMTSNTSIGGGVVGTVGANRIDDIFIGGRPLGTLPENTIKTSLIAYWPFDSDTNDYSGNGNHGTNYGAISAVGKVAGGYNFSALNAYVGAPQSATLKTAVVSGDFTMSFWGAFPVNADVAIISQSPGGGNIPKWMFAVQNFGADLGYHSWGDDIISRHLAQYTYSTHADLQHYTLVKRENNWFMYKNASRVGYSLAAPIPLADLGMDFEIGRAENNFYYKDTLDEVTIWNRALTLDEIEYLYNGGSGNSLMEYALTYTAGANGSLTGITSQTVRHGKDGTAVTAVANPGYHFVDWSDGSVSNPRTDLAVTGNVSVTANFAINTYTLTYTAGANGSLTGVTPQTVNHGADGTAVTAVANAGYHFVDWSDGSASNPRTDLAITGDITVTANFAVNPPVVVPTSSAGGRLPGYDPGSFLVTVPAPFSDIDGHWGRNYIDAIYTLGYVKGYEDNTFRPDEYIKRSEVAKIIALWLEKKIDDYVCLEAVYPDVSCEEWHGKYINNLTEKGILQGYGDGTFGPGKNITRAEALKIMLFSRALQNTNVDDIINPFNDVSPEAWFYKIILIGYNLNAIQGYGDGTFGPDNPVTRVEFAKIFVETYKL